MAAKSRKRLLKSENKLLEFDKIQLSDIICSICQSILLEPVTLPCHHNFCHCCFKGSIENNALCCPLCRLRIGSWLRTATKQEKIINIKLWDFIKSKFPREVNAKSLGEDVVLSQEQSRVLLSEPGEIRAEYEAELKRLQEERLQLEQKQLHESTVLIKKIQEEEAETRKKYFNRCKQDESLAQQIQKEHNKSGTSVKKLSQPEAVIKPRLKSSKIDAFLTKKSTPTHSEDRGSPEMVPSYSKFLKNKLDKKVRNFSGFWNKENGDNYKTKKTELLPHLNNVLSTDVKDLDKIQTATQSLPVSLPYTGILQHKINTIDKRSIGSGSVDSMRQELCYFKPVQGTTATSYNAKRGFPIRVPVMRLEKSTALTQKESPTRMQYVEGLCLLRNLSLAQNLPSAFVIALNKEHTNKSQSRTKSRVKQCTTTCSTRPSLSKGKHSIQVDGITKLNEESTLRRTRSMGSIPKEENETTPKKAKPKLRQVSSEKKPYLRSESKKLNAKKELKSPSLNTDSVNNNKVNLAVKNLSSPLQHCDVKKIFEEQLRIVKQMEQEKTDLELACKVDAELNGRMRLRRPAVKRHVPLSYALRPAKKLKA
ncbi:hypothetical protein MSG28_000464 [Choristoneura fumiferana]|uniref:Uncharacterized protein n=1 Tax=Choristoneura fumiferana TaxID=7141 RepID=A0ACC0K0X3_CHOFU|nr:hypothetical protein MSG28_000464 [Choristoneura fumiferana]